MSHARSTSTNSLGLRNSPGSRISPGLRARRGTQLDSIAVMHIEKGASDESAPSSATAPPSFGDLPSPEASYHDVPDGGVQAWIQVLVGHLIVFNTWGFIGSFGIFQGYFADAIVGSSPSAISWIGSSQIFLAYLFGFLCGRACDAGYIRHSFAFGNALQLIGVFATSCSDQYWQLLLAQGICHGLGSGLLDCAEVVLVSSYFARRRTVALALGACGAATGGIVFPVIAQQLLGPLGFGWTVRVMGFVMLFNAAVIMALARPRRRPPSKAPLLDWSAFADVPYMLCAVGMFLVHWAVYFVYYYVRPYGLDILHVSEYTSFELLLVINAVGAPGRLIPALLTDRHLLPGGVLGTLALTTASASACLFLWALVASLASNFAWVAVFGFFGAGMQGLFPAAVVALAPDLGVAGARVGMAFSLMSVASVTGPPLAGKLIEVAQGSYLGAQMWGGATLLVGAAVLVAALCAARRERRRAGAG